MKRILSMLLLACMIWSCVFSMGLAEDEATGPENTGGQLGEMEDQAAAQGVDLVIVLDMTNSMDNYEMNDVHNYRFDAAAMLIGMLDMNGSRVAVVPFANEPLPQYEESLMKWTDVSDSVERSNIVGIIYNMETRGDTNSGTALMKANQLLDNRGESKNDPMIVLLTDGENSMKDDNGNPRERVTKPLRVVDGRIQEGTAPEYYTKEDTDMIAKEAAQYARDHGYPIYTVALSTSKNTVPQNGLSLEQISQITGVDGRGSIEVTKDNANQLPVKFAEILADRIGSSVQMTMKPTYNDEKKRYEVLIPIVNASIKETNVVLMVKPLDNDKNDVIKPDTIRIEVDGQEPKPGSWETLKAVQRNGNTNGHYVMVKIRPQGISGKWMMSYECNGEDLDDISFNILYNYDIKLDAGVTANSQSQTFYKNDVLHLEAYFRKADENGTLSDDANLYADHRADFEGTEYVDDVNIVSTFTIYKWDNANQHVAEPVVLDQPMNGNTTGKKFEADFDLKSISPLLRAGDYVVEFKADGAGLKRSRMIPFHITNREPEPTVAKADDIYVYTEPATLIVNKEFGENKEDSWKVETTSGSLSKTADRIVTDTDGDKLVFYDLVAVDGVDQAAMMYLDEDRNTIRYETKMDANGQKVKAGTAEYWLFYDDQDGERNFEQKVKLVLNIESQTDELASGCQPVVKIYDKNGNETGNFLKNQPVTIKVGLCKKDESGNLTNEYDLGLLKDLQPSITVKDNGTLSGISLQSDEPEEEGDLLVYKVESTGNKQATWTVSLNISAFTVSPETITIQNNYAPKPKADDTAQVDLYWGRNWKLPLVGDMFRDNTSDSDTDFAVTAEGLTESKKQDEKKDAIVYVTIDGQMFGDADGDVLTYGLPRFYNKDGEELEPEKIKVEPVGDIGADGSGTYRIVYSGESTGWLMDWSFDAEMRITATDGDGKTGVYIQKFTVTNVRNQEKFLNLVVLAFVILLTILILIVHQARKPKFPTLNLTIREEPSLFNTSSETLSPVKKPTNVNAMGVDGDMAARHNISMEMLQNIIIRPIRSQSAVGVVCKKMFGGHEITLEDVALKPKKQHTWRLEEELVIRNINGEGMVAIKLEDKRGEDNEEFSGGGDFGDENEWVDNNTGFADNTYSGGKHTRRVKRKAAQTEENQSFTNDNNDGFDF